MAAITFVMEHVLHALVTASHVLEIVPLIVAEVAVLVVVDAQVGVQEVARTHVRDAWGHALPLVLHQLMLFRAIHLSRHLLILMVSGNQVAL